MNEKELNLLVDNLIIKSSNEDLYNGLSLKQKIIGALELLIGTATRSGVEVFFDSSNKYLWEEALTGLKMLNASISMGCYKVVLGNVKLKKYKPTDFKKLQTALVINDYDMIYDGIRKYVSDNSNEFKLKNN